VATDRRLYELGLDSPPCHDADAAEPGKGSYNPRLAYMGITRFYYPDELVRRWAREEEVARQRAQADAGAAVTVAAGANLSRLNFDYSWRRDPRIPWTPAQVFDDGEHTYIVLPAGARVEEAPVLLAVLADGTTALLNYHLERQTFVADRVVERAVLAAGSGKGRGGEQRIEIVNRAWQARRARRSS
jgi:type IV secretory pathway VirB9-like protein